jgi:putative membrane protein
MVMTENVKENTPSGALPKWINPYLTKAQVAQMESAVAAAEKTTSGEIVPVIVRRCADIKPPATLISLVSVLLFTLCAEVWMASWFAFQDVWVIVLGMIIAFAIGRFLANGFLARRLWIKPHDARSLANLRAEVEFYRAGIGATKDSTGILLFIAIEERQAVVLADKGISTILPPDTWDGVLKLMLDGFRSGDFAHGLTMAVTRCGELLNTNFPAKSGDVNELPNTVRFID